MAYVNFRKGTEYVYINGVNPIRSFRVKQHRIWTKRIEVLISPNQSVRCVGFATIEKKECIVFKTQDGQIFALTVKFAREKLVHFNDREK